MYIKLGNITVNMRQSIDDFMILAEVIDSPMSFERPVFVRNPEQLDIWFGKNFSGRDFLIEMLNRGVSLYLYKPISNESGLPDYIDLNSYEAYSEEFANPSMLPEVGEEGFKYKVGDDPTVWYIWFNESWVSEHELPQNLINSSISLNNRDVLALTDPKIENLPEYFYPEYNEYVDMDEDHLGLFSEPVPDIPSKIEVIDEGEKSYAYYKGPTLYVPKESLEEYKNSAYWEAYKSQLVGVEIDTNSSSTIEETTTLPQGSIMQGPNNDEIWYTSIDGDIVIPSHLSALPEIATNTYSEGKGVIKFESEITSIGESAFQECRNLASIIIPSCVTNIKRWAFRYCSGLASVNIPDGISEIGEKAFYGCSSLASVVIPESITSIEDSLFEYCTGLKSVIIPNSITSIGEYAFYQCSSLVSITIPDSVTSIGHYTFYHCGRLINMIFESTEPASLGYCALPENQFLVTTINSDEIQSGTITLAVDEELTSDGIGSGIQLVDGLPQLIGPVMATEDKIIDNNVVYDIIDEKQIILPTELYTQILKVNNFEDIRNGFIGLEYSCSDIEGNSSFCAYSYMPFRPIDLNTFNSIGVTNNKELTQKILTQMFMPFANFGMWSKTIGRDSEAYDDSRNIKVKIDNLGNFRYRIIITRYDYSETFEGSLFPDPGQRRLDDIISLGSNLVYCEIASGTKALRTGEFTLRGAVVEEYSKDMYWASLNEVFREDVYPDYFMIPDISEYVDGLDENYNYYKEYKTFLDIAKEHNLQVLIQNNDRYKLIEVDELPEVYDESTVYKIADVEGGQIVYKYYFRGEETTDAYIINLAEAGNDYIFNYIGDNENRLIYFFRDMTYNLSNRPGYYIYLSGLLNNIFSASPDDVVYNTPVSYPYDLDLKVVSVERLPDVPKTDTVYVIIEEDGKTHYYQGSKEITDQKLIDAVNDEQTKESLEKYKSNYLVFNNQMYYYRDYKNGEDYKNAEDGTTAWMRFAIGKVYRELQKNKWGYLSLKNSGRIRENIIAVLSRITYNFSVVRLIDLVRFNPVMSENRIELTINTYVADLVDNNIVLDLTINYNKEE